MTAITRRYFAAVLGGAAEVQARDLQVAGNAGGLRTQIANAGNDQEIESAFATISNSKSGALMVGSDPYYISRAK
jgi:hypothetical protein